MFPSCPQCFKNQKTSGIRPDVRGNGSYLRKSDGVRIQRFFCSSCRRSFSDATGDLEFGQNKRQINTEVFKLLSSCMSQRRLAKHLEVNLKTIARKLKFLGDQARDCIQVVNHLYPKSQIIEFDDLETFEHSKCKPLSITMAVEHKTRRILGYKVARMPAKGLLAAISRKKYGYRKDERPQARRALFREIQSHVNEAALFKSDKHTGYPKDVKQFFPTCEHQTYKGRRGCVTGQGELKAGGFDPLFTLNHTFAMFRANINRLVRRTWNTTKDPARLDDHIALYVIYHNGLILKP